MLKFQRYNIARIYSNNRCKDITISIFIYSFSVFILLLLFLKLNKLLIKISELLSSTNKN
jgi:hypothetical protein